METGRAQGAAAETSQLPPIPWRRRRWRNDQAYLATLAEARSRSSAAGQAPARKPSDSPVFNLRKTSTGAASRVLQRGKPCAAVCQ